jgi:hypothetical protein
MAQIANALRGGPSVGVANAGQEESPHDLPASIGRPLSLAGAKK